MKTMDNKKNAVLKQLLADFDKPNFDIEAWKIKASIILKKIFGANDEKISLIENLNYHFSSWSLRDHSGGKPHDPVKDQAREIIETAMLELSLDQKEQTFLSEAQNVLTGSQFSDLKNLLSEQHISSEALSAFFAKIDASTKDSLLVNIFSK
jgi:hypothetical protein